MPTLSARRRLPRWLLLLAVHQDRASSVATASREGRPQRRFCGAPFGRSAVVRAACRNRELESEILIELSAHRWLAAAALVLLSEYQHSTMTGLEQHWFCRSLCKNTVFTTCLLPQ